MTKQILTVTIRPSQLDSQHQIRPYGLGDGSRGSIEYGIQRQNAVLYSTRKGWDTRADSGSQPARGRGLDRPVADLHLLPGVLEVSLEAAPPEFAPVKRGKPRDPGGRDRGDVGIIVRVCKERLSGGHGRVQ